MKLPHELFGPRQILPRTPLLRLEEFLRARTVHLAELLRTQLSRRGARMALVVLCVGMAAEALWLYVVPFSWGWDTTPNLAIGRMYFGLPHEMWSIKYYYPPGYPIFLTLMGVHHLDTLTFLRFGTLFVGGFIPFLLFLMLRPFDQNAAFVAGLLFAVTFGNAVFSTELMNHHFHAFLLLTMSVGVAYHLHRPSSASAILLGCIAVLANVARDVTVFVFGAAVLVLFLADWIEQRSVVRPAKFAAIMVASFVALTGVLSVARQAALGEPFRFGLTNSNAARVLFQGAYYGASIYQKEFRPGEDFVFVKPENGPASKEFFEAVRTTFKKTDLKGAGLSDSNNIDEAIQQFIASPNVRNTYTIYWSLDASVRLDEQDRLLRNLVVETAISQPRILRYVIWNFWNYLFGQPILNEGSCVNCKCPPCFMPGLPQQGHTGGFMGAEVFSKMAGPGVIAEMAREHERGKLLDQYAWHLYADVRQVFAVKPVLTVLLLVSVFFARGKTRFLMIYCVAAVFIIGGTTSLAWPVQGRYQYPAIPFILAGAMVSLFEFRRRIEGHCASQPLSRRSPECEGRRKRVPD